MKILFFLPYPLKESPSQRFRFEQFFDRMAFHGFSFTCQSFLDNNNWTIFYKRKQYGKKALALLRGYFKRFRILFHLKEYDYVFIHREMTPLGPPVLEWFISKVLKKKIIYDFDDAIWLTDRSDESLILQALKWRSKVASICRWSYKVSCGNGFLRDFAKQYNSASVIIPTVVDTDFHHNPENYVKKTSQKTVIGWTGSHSTLKYLTAVVGALKEIERKHDNVEFTVIADKDINLDLKNKRFVKWNAASEIQDLLQFDIGIMPLPDDVWAKGKCGFKAIQYLALEIPAVVSDVGVNSYIVENNVCGFVCKTEDDWINAINTLITDVSLRKKIGALGRKKIIDNYSVASTSSAFLSLFE